MHFKTDLTPDQENFMKKLNVIINESQDLTFQDLFCLLISSALQITRYNENPRGVLQALIAYLEDLEESNHFEAMIEMARSKDNEV